MKKEKNKIQLKPQENVVLSCKSTMIISIETPIAIPKGSSFLKAYLVHLPLD